jgi:hypothetical protein
MKKKSRPLEPGGDNSLVRKVGNAFLKATGNVLVHIGYTKIKFLVVLGRACLEHILLIVYF